MTTFTALGLAMLSGVQRTLRVVTSTCGLGEGAEQGGEVFGSEEGFVALDVDVDVGVVELGDGVEAVGAAGEVGRGELAGPVVAVAEVGDFFGVGGDEDVVELGAGAGGLVDPGEHGASGDGAEDFAGQAGGGEAGGDDAEDGVRCRFSAAAGIKYDWRSVPCSVCDFRCSPAEAIPCRYVHKYTHRRCSSDG